MKRIFPLVLLLMPGCFPGNSKRKTPHDSLPQPTANRSATNAQGVAQWLRPYTGSYLVADSVVGDANHDGIHDLLLVLHASAENDPRQYEIQTRNDPTGIRRKFILLLGCPGSLYKLAVLNDNIIPSKNFSANDDQASYDSLQIRDGNICLTTIEDPRGGNAILRKAHYTFTYDSATASWPLQEATIVYIPFGQQADSYLLPSRALAGLSLGNFNVYRFSPRTFIDNDNNSFFLR